MPAIGYRFNEGSKTALEIALFAEAHESPKGKKKHGYLSRSQVDAVYELSLLRLFLGWELFLEAAFCHYAAGYASPGGNPASSALTPCSSVEAGLKLAMGGKKYFNWADPDELIDLCDAHLSIGRPTNVKPPFMTVLQTARNRLDAFKAIRDRVAHTSAYSRQRFFDGTRVLSGAQAVEDRPGPFLRSFAPAAPNQPKPRWLESVRDELVNLSNQIAP